MTNLLVLVADDEPSMLELVARHLKTMDNPKLDVIQASDGEEALRLAREKLPDLVVLDVMMPGMSGWEVCRKIREDVSLAHTGVLMLTGIGVNLNEMTSPLYGADAYIDKPFDFDELDEKVKETLSARADQRGSIARPSVNGVNGPAKASNKGPAPRIGRAPAKRKKAKKAAPAKKKAAPAKKKAAPAKKKAAPAKKKTAPAKKKTAPAKKKTAPAKKKKSAKRR
jgi:DNA-binding response OmpR family regulator